MKDLNNKNNSHNLNSNSSDANVPEANGLTTATAHYSKRLRTIGENFNWIKKSG